MSAPRNPWVIGAFSALAGLALGATTLWLGLRSTRDTPRAANSPLAALPDATPAEVASRGPGRAIPRCFVGALVAQESVDVGAEIEGTVARVAVRVGDSVQAGTVVAEIDRRDVRHALDAEQARLRQIQAAAKRLELEALQAEEELQRRRQLDGLVSREELQAAQLGFDQKKAAADAGRAELEAVAARVSELEDRLSRAVARAPFAGRIAQRYVDPGARVELGSPLVRVLGAGESLVRFAVPPEAVDLLPRGRVVRIEVTEPRLELEAEVSQVAPEIDQESLLIFVEARLSASLPPQVALGTESWVGFPREASCLR